MPAAEVTAHAEVRNQFGALIEGAEPDLANATDGSILMALDQTEMAAIRLLTRSRALMNALEELLLLPSSHDMKISTERSDSTARLLKEVCKQALLKMDEQKMTKSYYDAMKQVNIARSSVPVIALTKAFMPLCHVVLGVQYSPEQKGEALVTWVAARTKAMQRT
jgi:hypothetical protein